MIPLLDLPVLASLAPSILPAPQPDPVLRVEGPTDAFAELVARLGVALAAPIPEQSRGEVGKDLPDAAEQNGKEMPDPPAQPVVLADIAPPLPHALLPVLPVPQGEPAAGAPQGEDAAPLRRELPRAMPLTTGAVSGADPLDLPLPVSVGGSERVPSPVDDARPVAPLADVATQVARQVEMFAPMAGPREPAPVMTAAATAPPVPAISGAELEQLVEVLAQAREAGRGARGELAVRHAEFGTVAIRLERAEGETRATLAGRDPGFAPAVVAALAERAATGSFDQHQAPPHHRGGEFSFAGGHGDGRQPDRRASPERLPAANPAPPAREEPADDATRRGRFA